MFKSLIYFLILLIISGLFNTYTNAQIKLEEHLLQEFEFRALGPYRAGSWINEIAVPESNSSKYKYTFYVGARNGGVWKTENNGITFKPIFDKMESITIGALALAKSNPDILWVGTGESYNARSSHSGTGIYVSKDGGKTWESKGLKDSHHISKIIVHPENKDIVYVTVMGHLFLPNEERGIFKTTNGGKNWEKILFIDNNTGFIDLSMDYNNPEILYAAAYEKYRFPWHFEAGGKQSGIYKSSDGGKNWKKLTKGLPKGKTGRIGLDIYRSNSDVLYAVIEMVKSTKLKIKDLAAMDHLKPTDIVWSNVYKSTDKGESWKQTNHDTVNVSGKAPYSFNKIYIDPLNENNLYVISDNLPFSTDGGKTWDDIDWEDHKILKNVFGDYRTIWINPNDSRHMMFGSDGGLFVTYDKGKNAEHLYNIPLGEIYNISVDNDEPYNVYAGLQDHDVWKGPSNSWKGEISIEDWVLVGLWDGMYCPVDQIDSRWMYTSTQFGYHMRIDQLKGERKKIEPIAEKEKPFYRYPWSPPIIISPHNSKTIYTGGQILLQSKNRGDTWKEISPDLTTNNPEKIAGKGHMMYCTITTISESPIKEGLIYVGTDDGKVHVTKNHGEIWNELTQNLVKVGAPENLWVTRIFASAHKEGTAYLCKSGFKTDDFTAYVYKTTDYGKTWIDISANLPNKPVNIIIEDHKNPNLLFIGNDHGIYFSLDGGKYWNRFNINIPNVPIKDLVIHKRENDLIAGSYGRGLYINDITVLQQLSTQILNKDVHLFEIETKPVRNTSESAYWGSSRLLGDKHLFTPNEPNGLTINYYLKDDINQNIELKIYNMADSLLKTLETKNTKGIHKAVWPTWKEKQGKYKVILRTGDMVIKKEAILKPAIIYPILNYRKAEMKK
ncbi:MAG: hypothetical protein DRJ10_03750 [Bacteroidetes bacterium]|nr:MAG: hypothetical protein DRJ10_03750 [Bacteroidota bacterium]